MSSRNIALIGGGSGFIGSHLIPVLQNNGFETRILTRSPSEKGEYEWHPSNGEMDEKALDDVTHIVNFAGTPILQFPMTKKTKQKIIDSRVDSNQTLITYLGNRKGSESVKAVLCASGVDYYGDREKKNLSEEQHMGTGFLANVCRSWETSSEKFRSLGLSTFIVRFGIVLGKNGGILKPLITQSKFRIMPYFGNGEQWKSWIHIHDLVHLISKCLSVPSLAGVYNGVAPNPVTYKELINKIEKYSGRSSVNFPIPSFLPQLVINDGAEMMLNSNHVSSAKAERIYNFKYKNIDEALMDIFSEGS